MGICRLGELTGGRKTVFACRVRSVSLVSIDGWAGRTESFHALIYILTLSDGSGISPLLRKFKTSELTAQSVFTADHDAPLVIVSVTGSVRLRPQ
ncbi:hypothetical protein BaRGS_00025970 [Batillaria attramentaria]|uniref:Uncharacterized protein n=1 Tax=Batillaria attramentaria TaxID=370345 RepID=A0ABD0K6P7_9CAEN